MPLVRLTTDFGVSRPYVDSLGNLITNITCEHLAQIGPLAECEVRLMGRTLIGIDSTYADAHPGSLLALCDSQGRLEIAMANANAARELSIHAGTAVEATCPARFSPGF